MGAVANASASVNAGGDANANENVSTSAGGRWKQRAQVSCLDDIHPLFEKPGIKERKCPVSTTFIPYSRSQGSRRVGKCVCVVLVDSKRMLQFVHPNNCYFGAAAQSSTQNTPFRFTCRSVSFNENTKSQNPKCVLFKSMCLNCNKNQKNMKNIILKQL